MVVSENNGTPKSSILIGFSIINHPIWGTPIFGNTHIQYWVQWGIKASTAKTVAGSVDVSFLVGERGLPSWHPSSIPLEGGEVILQPILFKCDTVTSIYGIYSYDCLCKYVRILTSITWKHTMRLLKISRQENVGDFSWVTLRVEEWSICHVFSCRPRLRMVQRLRVYIGLSSPWLNCHHGGVETPTPTVCFGRLVHAPWFCLLHHRQPT